METGMALTFLAFVEKLKYHLEIEKESEQWKKPIDTLKGPLYDRDRSKKKETLVN